MRKIIFYSLAVFFFILFARTFYKLLFIVLDEGSFVLFVPILLISIKSYWHEFGHYIFGKFSSVQGMKLRVMPPAIYHKEWVLFAERHGYTEEELKKKYEDKSFDISSLVIEEKEDYLKVQKKLFICTLGGPIFELMILLALLPFVASSVTIDLLLCWLLFSISMDMGGSDGETIFEYLHLLKKKKKTKQVFGL